MAYRVKDVNKSSLNTKAKIKEAFLKLLSERKTAKQIKVKELCQEGGINRSTFYIHYKDIHDVEDSIIQAFYNRAIKMIPEKFNELEDIKNFYREVFEYVFENKTTLEALFKDRESIAIIQSAKVKMKRAFANSLHNSDKKVRNALALILFNGVFTTVYENLIGMSSVPLEDIRDQALRITDYLFAN